MSDYGMKVSRQGYDVKTCADHQLLFSSSFKLPLLLFSGSYKITSFGSDINLVSHNLGYIPTLLLTEQFYVSEVTDNEINWGTSKGNWDAPVIITENEIKYLASNYSENTSISWRIFNWDLETEYISPIVDTSADTQGVISEDYGFKVSKPGYNATTTNLDQLSAFSGNSVGGSPVRSGIIHRVLQGTAINGNTTSFAHGLSYQPRFQFFGKRNDAANQWFPIKFTTTDGLNVRTWADNTNVNIKQDTGSNKSVAVIIFKDPF